MPFPATRTAIWGPVIAACLVAGCTLTPVGMAPSASRPAPAGPITDAPAPSAMAQAAPGAEQACINAGTERGLEVLGVVGTRAGPSADGEPTRDVMLRVQRGDSVIEVRCNYSTTAQMARIMLI